MSLLAWIAVSVALTPLIGWWLERLRRRTTRPGWQPEPGSAAERLHEESMEVLAQLRARCSSEDVARREFERWHRRRFGW